MKLFDQIQSILDQGILWLSLEDNHQLLQILSELYDLQADYDRQIFLLDQQIDSKRSDITLELKAQKAQGDKNITDLYISAQIDKQIVDLVNSKIEKKYILSKIKWKIDVVRQTITLCRDKTKYDPNTDPIQLA